MSLVILLDERQNFRFKPKSSFVPSGSFCVLHKLWKARFFGCNHGHKGFACRANLKFFDLDKAGFAQKLKLRRQYCSVRFLRAAPTLLWLHLKASFFIRRCFLSWANLLEVAFRYWIVDEVGEWVCSLKIVLEGVGVRLLVWQGLRSKTILIANLGLK